MLVCPTANMLRLQCMYTHITHVHMRTYHARADTDVKNYNYLENAYDVMQREKLGMHNPSSGLIAVKCLTSLLPIVHHSEGN